MEGIDLQDVGCAYEKRRVIKIFDLSPQRQGDAMVAEFGKVEV